MEDAAIAHSAGQPARIAAIPPDNEFHVLFNVEGHQVIALAAMSDLQARSQTARARVDAILKAGGRSLMDAAIFPDVIREKQPKTKPFHFIDFLFTDATTGDPPMPKPPHVVAQIAIVTKELQAKKATAQARVDSLSWMIHMVGDIHQPLHCASRTSALHPDGDRGGNSFRLRGGAPNLHSLWDSSVDVTGGSNEAQLADSILKEHSRASLAKELALADPEQWARASYRVARAAAYTMVENAANPPTPTKSYIKTMQTQGRRQAALAAYRLSDTLKALFA